jgi:hypothetical protein
MKSRGLLADLGGMSTDTLTAPPEAAFAADTASEPTRAFDDAGSMQESVAPGEAAVAAKESGAPGEPSVKDELTAQFEAEAAAEAAAQTAAQMPAMPQSPAVRLLSLPLRFVVAIVVLMDAPFAFLGAGIKRLIGGVAIITAVMAAATWVAGPRVVATLAARAREAPLVAAGHDGKEPAAEKHAEKSHAADKPAAGHH